ncbi:Crp/Fnr family transcriptional regulator [Caenibacillus caldisaponilyticus]|uniref:Crp/Fnr family transcriptional regulator n=1 Tax=Caenibacillus caldisaponilyticus TaxID=1674942 RepID=UPI000988353C|nr:Crp/Fnr family transcriptional regulator [Caenibacillus caldisaponilyticus]
MRTATPILEEHGLYRFPVFRGLSEARLQEIMKYAFFRKYRKGQILFMEGDPRDRIYFLLNGYIKLVSMNEDYSNHLFLYLKPYCMFPYIGLFNDKDYRFSGEAVTDVELLYVPTVKFEQLIRSDNDALINLIRIMGDKMHEHEIRLQNLIKMHATDRVRHLISLLIQDLGEKTGAGTIRIPCPLTTTDLAEMAGTSRETVSHTLQEYKASGKLVMESKIITVTDPAFFIL